MHLKESEASGKISGLEKKIQYAEIEKVQSNLEAASLLISNQDTINVQVKQGLLDFWLVYIEDE